MKTDSQRPLYKISLNWYGEVHILYRHAKSRGKALTLGVRGLEKKLGKESGSCYMYFVGKDRYRIEEVKEKLE